MSCPKANALAIPIAPRASKLSESWIILISLVLTTLELLKENLSVELIHSMTFSKILLGKSNFLYIEEINSIPSLEFVK